MTTTGPRRPGGILDPSPADSHGRARKLQLNEIHVVRFVPGTSRSTACGRGPSSLRSDCFRWSALWPSWRSIGIVGALVLIAFLAARLPKGISRGSHGGWAASWRPGHSSPSSQVASRWSPRFAQVGPRRPRQLRSFFNAGCGRARYCRPARLDDALGRPVTGSGEAARPAASCPCARRRARRSDRPLDQVPAVAPRGGAGSAGGSQGPPAGRSPVVQGMGDEAVEVVFGALANAIRRAREIAEAIEARGGVPTVALRLTGSGGSTRSPRRECNGGPRHGCPALSTLVAPHLPGGPWIFRRDRMANASRARS